MVQEYNQFFSSQKMIDNILNKKIIADNTGSDLKVFYIDIDEETRTYINTKLGVDIGTKVPLRITSTDIDEHADVRLDTKESDDTYIIYISDPGNTKLILDGQEYPLHKNTAFKFGSDVLHSTIDTNISRTMLGPFNRKGVMMGMAEPEADWWLIMAQQKTPKGVVYCGRCTRTMASPWMAMDLR